MRRESAGVLAMLIGLHSAVLGAQQVGAVGQSPPPPTASRPAPASPPPTVESLGVSFDRIKRHLETKPPAKAAKGLKIEYYVEVIAEAPPFQLFGPDEPSFGPVPGAAPSHSDMMRHITPLAFSSPRATLVSFGGSKGESPKLLGQDFWETQTRMAKEVARRKKIEEERERQRKLKESVVVSPPKVPGGPGGALPRP